MVIRVTVVSLWAFVQDIGQARLELERAKADMEEVTRQVRGLMGEC